MKQINKFFLAAVIATLFSTFSYSQEQIKVGFVDTEKIFREANLARASAEKIDKEFSKRQKDLQEMGNRLKTSSEKFEKDAPILSERDRSSRQRELAELDRELQRKGREFQEDLNQRRQEEYNALIVKANQVIKELAEKEKYDIIFQAAVYRNQRIDVTDKVLKVLNASK